MLLGSGAYGDVWRGMYLGREVAIKRMRQGLGDDFKDELVFEVPVPLCFNNGKGRRMWWRTRIRI